MSPCPFCGAAAEGNRSSSGVFWIACSGCGVETSTSSTIERALSQWNARAHRGEVPTAILKALANRWRQSCDNLQDEAAAVRRSAVEALALHELDRAQELVRAVTALEARAAALLGVGAELSEAIRRHTSRSEA